MYTLDTHPEEIINDPRMWPRPMCRTTIRVRRWSDGTMRELLSRPTFSITRDACNEIRMRIWDSCDEALKQAILKHLEKR